MSDLIGFGRFGLVYCVLLALGIVCAFLGVVSWLAHRLPEIRLSGLDFGSGQGDFDDMVLPKEAVYFSPTSASLQCRDEYLGALRLIASSGVGLTSFAAFGIISYHLFSASELARLLVSMLIGLITVVIAFILSTHALFPRSTKDVTCADLRGGMGEVTVPIPQDSFGQIATTIKGRRVTFSARALDLSAIPRGAVVQVVDLVGSRALVQPAGQEYTR
jgi:hypothetical protein